MFKVIHIQGDVWLISYSCAVMPSASEWWQNNISISWKEGKNMNMNMWILIPSHGSEGNVFLWREGGRELQQQAMSQLGSLCGTCNTFQPHPIILRVQNTTSHIWCIDSFIEERIRKEFGVELRMVWRSVEDEVTDPSDFVSMTKGCEIFFIWLVGRRRRRRRKRW